MHPSAQNRVCSTDVGTSDSTDCQPKILVAIDSGIKAYQMLEAGVMKGVSVVILSSDRDGVEQITETLKLHTEITHLHIVAHGSPGCLDLGNSQLSLATLDRYAWDLQTWFPFNALHNSPCALLLYGCNVAAGDAGVDFLQSLYQLTGASIAASATPVGSPQKGGTWQLEVTIGKVEVSSVFQEATMKAYDFTLLI